MKNFENSTLSAASWSLPALMDACCFAQVDGLNLRYGQWPSAVRPLRGSVLLLQGRAEFLEKYGETIRDLNARGWDVFSFDWRGQGKSDRMLSDPLKGHVQSYDQYLADLDFFVRSIVSGGCREPLILLAHSMGAHVALRYLVLHPNPFAKIVLAAPMIGISSAPVSLLGWISRLQVRLQRQDRQIPGTGRLHSVDRAFTGNRLTSDAVRFDRMRAYVRQNPRLAAHCVTYGWMAATLASIHVLQHAPVEERITCPALFAIAEQDRVVSNKAAYRLAGRLPNYRWVVVPGARHELLQERDELRNLFWRAFDRFLNP